MEICGLAACLTSLCTNTGQGEGVGGCSVSDPSAWWFIMVCVGYLSRKVQKASGTVRGSGKTEAGGTGGSALPCRWYCDSESSLTGKHDVALGQGRFT